MDTNIYPTIRLNSPVLANFTTEYYFYLNANKTTKIYTGYGTDISPGLSTIVSNYLEWNLTHDQTSGLMYDMPNQAIRRLNISLQSGWYHFAASYGYSSMRYFINGKQIFDAHSIPRMDASEIGPSFYSNVDKLDSLRVSDETLYFVPFTTLPHM